MKIYCERSRAESVGEMCFDATDLASSYKVQGLSRTRFKID
jgi:hypothetical protein